MESKYLLPLFALGAFSLFVWAYLSSPVSGASGPELKELTDLSQFQKRFNAGEGKHRLVLLLSPT